MKAKIEKFLSGALICAIALQSVTAFADGNRIAEWHRSRARSLQSRVHSMPTPESIQIGVRQLLDFVKQESITPAEFQDYLRSATSEQAYADFIAKFKILTARGLEPSEHQLTQLLLELEKSRAVESGMTWSNPLDLCYDQEMFLAAAGIAAVAATVGIFALRNYNKQFKPAYKAKTQRLRDEKAAYENRVTEINQLILDPAPKDLAALTAERRNATDEAAKRKTDIKDREDGTGDLLSPILLFAVSGTMLTLGCVLPN